MNRFYILWLYAVTLTALASASVQSMMEEKRLLNEASARISSVATSTEDSVLANYHAKRFDRIAKMVERLRSRQGVLGMSVCAIDAESKVVPNHTISFPHGAGWESLCDNHRMVARAMSPDQDASWSGSSGKQVLQYFAHYIEGPAHVSQGRHETIVLILAQDLSYLRGHWISAFARTFALTFILGLALMLLVAFQVRGWLKQHLGYLHHNLRSLIAGRKPATFEMNHPEVAPDLVPLTKDIDKLHTKILSLSANERAPRTSSGKEEPIWLSSLKESMGAKKLTIIANREPYIHQRKNDKIDVVRPASGLVTALEPILRQCGGLWVAHGSGTADADVVDENNEVAVPPASPKYKLRRVWLTKEEEAGYYYGFSNEGFWPLCHLAHNRPIFRLSDWEQYKTVNQKFTDSIPESSMTDDSLILVQDYHFAMLPRMLRSRVDARNAQGANHAHPKVGLFWHIPWPNPETFGICPWNEELLRGMLGADVIGFHTQYHCNNFLETCNRYLEARIDYEHFTVTMENHVTQIRAFPIGIDTSPVRFITDQEKDDLKLKYGIKARYVAVGVDRLDYTKGLIERVEGVERFLEKYPDYVGQFSLVQMGSPSRSQIPAYRLLAEQLEAVVNRVNERFGEKVPEGDNSVAAKDVYKPVIFLATHHEWDEIQYFYQMGDICMVTSLHDGMNLVAKEYVWCQRPDRGSLILSKFTGASRELTDAFIVNPYSTEEVADAIANSITMSSEERFRRMSSMRDKVRSRSAYHWASDLIRALIRKQDESSVVIQMPERDRRDRSPLAKALDF
jgi:trehalose-6-phosphate synthase